MGTKYDQLLERLQNGDGYLRLGDKGQRVNDLQQVLQTQGYYSGKIDGAFGPALLTAVRAFQKDNNLLVDGVVGQRFLTALRNEVRDPEQMSEKAITEASQRLGVEIELIKAVAEVESCGIGFLVPGKPKILYERHIMHRLLIADGYYLLADLLTQHRPDIAFPEWGGYEGGELEWVQLDMAKQVHPEFAMQSCSWGRFQILGLHYKRLGYPSVLDFVGRMCRHEDDHLDAFVRFIASDPKMHTALRQKDWAAFCYRYNGPNYKKQPVPYDVKLERTYQRLLMA